MKQQSKKPPETVEYVAQPVMIGHDLNTPDVEPLFANHFEVLATTSDVFLDIGIIDPRDMAVMMEAAQKNPAEVQSVRFSVLQRVAMSPASFILLANKVNRIAQVMIARRQASAASENPDVTKQR